MSELRHRACAARRAAALSPTSPLKGATPPAGQRRCQHQRDAAAAAARPQPRPAAAGRGAAPAALASVTSALGRAFGATALGVSLLLAPMGAPASAAQATLADLVAGRYAGISSSDEEVGREKLEAFSESLWLEFLENGRPIGDGSPEYLAKLFDLNADGRVSGEEVLRSLALDGAVNARGDAGEDVFKVFDADRSGTVDAAEWARALGDLGPSGEGAKAYIYGRVDRLSDSDGALDASDFGTALRVARDVVLGGGPQSGLVSGGGF
ncbi:hypothetical protein Rsub_08654 [Raphidocelis subcapitata]|uniref:EF-hand domain-containing protein n=1 Tax=Raphidocelis subcapitata TaxID=307507 RepID=A0A2V0P9P9_9CHLO|nr:hypothetical protein Rsub_08654 [Raphidocelis subcapitata]|eukprot:GBF95672.1 hypothetical protein Rsub_08654 [Raphidocelis subcapitata]